MFDTSLIRPRAIAANRYGLLGVSVVIHSGAVFAAVALTLASTRLPSQPPNQMEIYRAPMVPTVPQAQGNPGLKPKPRTLSAALPKPQPTVQTAPNVVPDRTPAVAGPEGPVNPDAVGEPADGPIGVPWGDPNSVSADVLTPQQVSEPPRVIYTPGAEVTKARVLTRVEPVYPPIMVQNRIAATVTVHCTVDRFGNIRDPEIIRSSFPPFNNAVLDAVRQWTFAPGMRRGEPVDTYFELTVRFVVR